MSQKTNVRTTKVPVRPPSAQSALLKVYLIAFNLVSFLGWSYVLYNTISHLASYVPAKDTPLAEVTVAANKLWKFIVVFLAKLGFVTPADPVAQAQDAIYENIPTGFLPIVHRAKSVYDAGVGEQVRIVQSLAVLEVVHALLGLVRSSLATTVMQVASRLYLVWGIGEKFPETHSNPLYTSMVFAWSVTEVLRYPFYAFNLAGYEPSILSWLRYTTFFVLYPVGAVSEAFLALSTLPLSTPIGTWSNAEYVRLGLFAIWWPGLYIMYTHMIRQRSKVLGKKTPTKVKTT